MSIYLIVSYLIFNLFMDLVTNSNAMTNLNIIPHTYSIHSIKATSNSFFLTFATTDQQVACEAVIDNSTLRQSNARFKIQQLFNKMLSSSQTTIIIDKNESIRLILVPADPSMHIEQIRTKLQLKSNQMESHSNRLILWHCGQSIQDLAKQLENMQIGCQSTTLKSINNQLPLYKHSQILANNNIITNHSIHNQIRWVVINHPLSEYFKTKWTITVQQLQWICVGIADRRKLSSRKYSGLNGKSNHGCYVMDCLGWVHTALPSIYNYQQLGFTFSQNDELVLELDPLAKQLTICVRDRDVKLVLPINGNESWQNQWPVIGVNKCNKVRWDVLA